MPRDGSGVYTLPAGNPVVTNTVIASTWANGTMSDIAAQLNNVLTRDGLLGPTGPFKLQDGTVAAPGLAWNSEPGLGMYRSAAGVIRWAASGGDNMVLDAASAIGMTLSIGTRSLGATTLSMGNNAIGSANRNLFQITQNGDGSAVLRTTAIGTATKGSMGYQATSHLFDNYILLDQKVAGQDAQIGISKPASGRVAYISGMTNSFLRWAVFLGNNATESGGNTGSDFSISRYTDAGGYVNDPLQINRQSGNAYFGGGVVASTMFQSTYHVSGGWASETWILPAGTVGIALPTWPTTNGGLIVVRGNANANYTSGAVVCHSGSGNTAAVLLNGANAWSAPSDERLKNIHEEVSNGLDAVLAMRPIRYNYKTDEPDYPVRVGLTAQSVQVHAAEAVHEMADLEADSEGGTRSTGTAHLGLTETAVIPFLVNAIKTLNDRLTALETA